MPGATVGATLSFRRKHKQNKDMRYNLRLKCDTMIKKPPRVCTHIVRLPALDTCYPCRELARGRTLCPSGNVQTSTVGYCRQINNIALLVAYSIVPSNPYLFCQEAFFVEVELLANEGHGCVLAPRPHRARFAQLLALWAAGCLASLEVAGRSDIQSGWADKLVGFCSPLKPIFSSDS